MNLIELDKLSDKILDKIRRRPGHYYDLGYLAKCFGVKDEEIASALDQLQAIGYKVKAKKGKWSFVSPPDLLLPAEIMHGLKAKVLGQNIYAFKTVGSTNTVAHQLAVNGVPEGTLVTAEHQSKGRGRRGRIWQSPENTGIYMSLVLRPKIHPSRAPGISLIAGVALAETILEYESIDVKIKWPNDVLIAGRKTAGILTELSGEPDNTHFVIVGIGINVNQKKNQIPPELADKAISLRIGLKEKINRAELLKMFLNRFEKTYFEFKKNDLKPFRHKIRKFSYLSNKEVQLKFGRKRIIGIVKDIDNDGCLVLETKDGPVKFNAGEVTLS